MSGWFNASIVALSLVAAPAAQAQAPAPTPAQTAPSLFGENLMTPVPAGFKLGAQESRGPFAQMEYIAQAETVQDWTVMITVTIIKGHFPVTPDQFSQHIADGYHGACAHGEGHKMVDGQTNGYAYSQWMLTCDLNPMTSKPEFLVMRTTQGADALYNVQYAFRQAPGDATTKQAIAYLETTSVCDTRLPDRDCKVPAK